MADYHQILGDIQKECILEARDLGKSLAEIGTQLNILRTIVTNFLQSFEKYRLKENLSHFGHLQKTLE